MPVDVPVSWRRANLRTNYFSEYDGTDTPGHTRAHTGIFVFISVTWLCFVCIFHLICVSEYYISTRHDEEYVQVYVPCSAMPCKYIHQTCKNKHTCTQQICNNKSFKLQLNNANTHTELATNMQCIHTIYTKQQTSKSKMHNHSCNQQNINIRNNQSHMHTQMHSANKHAAHAGKNISHEYF